MFAYDSFLTKGISLHVTLVNTERKVNNKLIPFFQLQYLLSLILSMLIQSEGHVIIEVFLGLLPTNIYFLDRSVKRQTHWILIASLCSHLHSDLGLLFRTAILYKGKPHY